jgi:GNAT superfamily N-acetyltransferase
VVGDRWQRLGLGTALLERLTERARAEGVTRSSGVVLAENEEAIGLLERLGATRHAAGPEVRFEIDLSAGDDAGPTLRELLPRGGRRPARPGARAATERAARRWVARRSGTHIRRSYPLRSCELSVRTG